MNLNLIGLFLSAILPPCFASSIIPMLLDLISAIPPVVELNSIGMKVLMLTRIW